jgi:hypothetical protein
MERAELRRIPGQNNDGVREGRGEAQREAFRDFYSYSSITVSLFKRNIMKR